MKKIVFLIITLLLCMLPCVICSADDTEINATYNGKSISFDSELYNDNGRIMVPARAVFEAIGADVEWYEAEKTVIAKMDDITVSMTVGENEYTINEKTAFMDTPLTLHNDRVYAPVRFEAEAFGKKVSYHNNSCTAIISDNTEYKFYENITLPVPTFESATGASLIDSTVNNGSQIYYYSYDENYVTEYFNAIQSDFGYQFYNMQIEENGTSYIYVSDNLKVTVIDNCNEADKICIAVLPDTDGLYTETNSVQLNKEDSSFTDKQPQMPEKTNPEQNNEPTPDVEEALDYNKVTGAELIEKYAGDDGNTIYCYSYNPFQFSKYEKYLSKNNWELYDFDFDIDSFMNTKYWANGDKILAVSTSYLFSGVLIVYPDNN